MNYKIDKIEGIGPKFAEVLNKAGIKNTKQLLDQAAAKKGRKDLAEKTGLDEQKILKWANMCDLMRIKGVAEEYSELLEAAGVDTVKELAQRKPENLWKAIIDANAKSKLVRQTPGLPQVESWVSQAKTLPPTMTY